MGIRERGARKGEKGKEERGKVKKGTMVKGKRERRGKDEPVWNRNSFFQTDFAAKVGKLATLPQFLFCLPDDQWKLLAQMTLYTVYSTDRLPG